MPKKIFHPIKIIGVGNAGSNAVNHMFQQKIKGVDYVICNTDAQTLEHSDVPNKIHLGIKSNSILGDLSAIESSENIRNMLYSNTEIVFILAAMEEGMGVKATSIIAKEAREMEILTIGIVSTPFQFEIKTYNEQINEGVKKLREEVDSLIAINNDKLQEVYDNLSFKDGVSKVDEILSTTIRTITKTLTHHDTQNIDLNTIKTIFSNSGKAIIGLSTASGRNRTYEAITKALDSPLLNNNKITGAKSILLYIASGSKKITVNEITKINNHIQNEAGYANIFIGVGKSKLLEESIAVTIIATGFNNDEKNLNTKKSNLHTKSQKIELEKDQELIRIFSENQNRNRFLMKEIILIGLMVLSIFLYLFALNDWKNSTAFCLFFIVLSLVHLKLYHILYERNNKYIELNENIKTNFQNTEKTKYLFDVKQENEAQKINNIDVKHFEIIESNEDDFIITSTEYAVETVASAEEIEDEQQITLTFDMPLNEPSVEVIVEQEEETIVHDSISEIKNIEVNDAEEVKSETIHTLELDGHIEVDSIINSKQEEIDIFFEIKVFEEETPEAESDLDPMNSSISDVLKERVDARRQKMKTFNYQFNHSKIDDIEKIPAYKRKGINLEEIEHSTDDNVSKTVLEDDDDIQLRNNNSFLHDNVD